LYFTATYAHFGLLSGFVIAIKFIQQKRPFAALLAHSRSKVVFAFFGFPLADENKQDRFFFLEDICALIMACKIACQTMVNDIM